MSNISVRLPDEVLRRLEREAKSRHQLRSELIREALVEFLDRLARDRYLDEMVAEARAGYENVDIRRDALEIERDFSDVTPDAPDADDKWWK